MFADHPAAASSHPGNAPRHNRLITRGMTASVSAAGACAEHRAPTAEATLPEPVAQDYRRPWLHRELLARERAADEWGDGEHGKEIFARGDDAQALAPVGGREVAAAIGISRRVH